jgi:hypothetical protein
VSAYDILRSAPPNSVAEARARGARLVTLGSGVPLPGDFIAVPNGAQSYSWELLTTITALHYLSDYSYIAPTTGDSTGSGNPRTAYMVVAHNATYTRFWPSGPATGYSVDNLPPVAPAPFTGAYLAGATHLHWGENSELDLAGYRVYRGTSAGFIPSPGNLIAALTDTTWSDAGPAGAYYKLSAVDAHGNESSFALLSPSGTLDVGGGVVPRDLAFAAPSPNPARASTLLSFALPHEGPVTLAIYDMVGRRVRQLNMGRLEVGEHHLSFDLRDDGGRRIPSGLYFVRLAAVERVLVRRLAIVE